MAASEATASESRLVTIGVGAFGVYNLAIGLTIAIAPGTFFELVGPFGERNDHYLRDMSTWYAALGVMLLLAVRRPSWRVPLLALLLLQDVLHLINHIADVDAADPSWVGPADVVSLAVLGVLGWLLWRAAGGRQARA